VLNLSEKVLNMSLRVHLFSFGGTPLLVPGAKYLAEAAQYFVPGAPSVADCLQGIVRGTPFVALGAPSVVPGVKYPAEGERTG
jgi:hypothetical protein